jgi:hypothetical protein
MKIAGKIASVAAVCCMLAAGSVLAEDTPSAKDAADLTKVTPAVKLMRSQLDDLLTRMIQIAATLEKTDPESARAIKAAAQLAQKAAVTESVDQVLDQLTKNLSQSQVTQEKVQKDLENMLQALRGQYEKKKTDYPKELAHIRDELVAERQAETALSEPGGNGTSQPAKDSSAKAGEQEKITSDLGNVQQEIKELDAKSGEMTPGGDHVAGAKTASGKATQGLKQDNPGDAAKDQKKVIDELTRAINEIDSRLAQIENQRQEDQLASLDALLTEVLDAQKEHTIGTREVYAKRDAQGNYDRKLMQRLAALGEGEHGLAEKVAQALKMLENESVKVLPVVLGDVKDKMLTVEKNLRDRQAGELTQCTQREIEQSLEEIVKSLRESYRQHLAKKTTPPQPPPPTPPNVPPPPPPPLVPPLAEMKLLLNMQVRVGRQTQELNDRATKMDPSLATAEHQRLSETERMILKLTDEMRDKTSQPK